MDTKFLTAFIAPQKWDICGYKLKPYSLRIHFNLVAVESPFVNGGVPTPLQTVDFLRYCSDGNKNILDAGSAKLRDAIFLYKIMSDVKKHVDVIKRISLYMREYTDVPSFKMKNTLLDSSPEPKQENVISQKSVPDLMTMMCLCMQKVNLTEEQVMTMPIGKVAWYAAATAVLEGTTVSIEESIDDEGVESIKKEMDAAAESHAKTIRENMANGIIPKRKVKVE